MTISPCETVVLIAELSAGVQCELNHGPEEPPQAFDYLCLPLGITKCDVSEVKHNLTIPICKECSLTIQGDEWILLYCIDCGNSRWIARKLAKHKYREQDHCLWLRGCPECSNRLGGLYFG